MLLRVAATSAAENDMWRTVWSLSSMLSSRTNKKVERHDEPRRRETVSVAFAKETDHACAGTPSPRFALGIDQPVAKGST